MSTSDVDGVCENLESCKLSTGRKISDKELFKHPPSIFGDCPICFERIPTLHTGSKYKTCCGKMICSGCIHAPVYDNQGNEVAEKKCPFCRDPAPKKIEEALERSKKRMDAGDSRAMHNLGMYYFDGSYGFTQDYAKALELYHRAGELGLSKAYGSIGYSYENGRGVEVDKKKAVYYYELAAIMGNAIARYNLGVYEESKGNWDRALKHFMIAVSGGHGPSLKEIQRLYTNGHVTKDDYTNALRSYQEYLGEIKSRQRDEAAAARENYRYY